MSELFEILGDMPPAFWLVWWFVVGSFVGSFLNVVVYRLPRNCLSINNPRRSICPSCRTQLKWNDNIPIAGWALLKGRCRYCGARFGARYPLVELLTALLFLAAAARALYGDGHHADTWQSWLILLHMVCLIGVLLPWALIDIDLQLIPYKLTFGPLLVFVPFAAFADAFAFGLPEGVGHLLFPISALWLNSLLSNLCVGLAAALGLWLVGKAGNVLFRKRAQEIGGAMGGADVHVMILLGVALGWPKLLAAFFLAVCAGAVFGVVQVMRKRGHGIPFGPYLALGAILATLAAPWLFSVYTWYKGLLEGAAGA
jgi:leader peptidase (prepilin peptidase) / N-methyltransferase